MGKLEEFKKEHQKLIDENNELVKRLNIVRNKISEISEQILRSDSNFVKVECMECNGTGIVQLEDKKVVCKVCRGKKYLWLRRYDETLQMG